MSHPTPKKQFAGRQFWECSKVSSIRLISALDAFKKTALQKFSISLQVLISKKLAILYQLVLPSPNEQFSLLNLDAQKI